MTPLSQVEHTPPIPIPECDFRTSSSIVASPALNSPVVPAPGAKALTRDGSEL